MTNVDLNDPAVIENIRERLRGFEPIVGDMGLTYALDYVLDDEQRELLRRFPR